MPTNANQQVPQQIINIKQDISKIREQINEFLTEHPTITHEEIKTFFLKTTLVKDSDNETISQLEQIAKELNPVKQKATESTHEIKDTFFSPEIRGSLAKTIEAAIQKIEDYKVESVQYFRSGSEMPAFKDLSCLVNELHEMLTVEYIQLVKKYVNTPPKTVQQPSEKSHSFFSSIYSFFCRDCCNDNTRVQPSSKGSSSSPQSEAPGPQRWQ